MLAIYFITTISILLQIISMYRLAPICHLAVFPTRIIYAKLLKLEPFFSTAINT